MPRACPVEPHAVSYCSGEREAPRDKPVAARNLAALCSGEREAPRDKPVASRAVWLRLIFKDHKPTAKFRRRYAARRASRREDLAKVNVRLRKRTAVSLWAAGSCLGRRRGGARK